MAAYDIYHSVAR